MDHIIPAVPVQLEDTEALRNVSPIDISAMLDTLETTTNEATFTQTFGPFSVFRVESRSSKPLGQALTGVNDNNHPQPGPEKGSEGVSRREITTSPEPHGGYHSPSMLRDLDALILPGCSRELIHHWMTFFAENIIVIDTASNPCWTVAFPMAMKGVCDMPMKPNGSTALFHALCAVSAHSLLQLKGPSSRYLKLALQHEQALFQTLRHFISLPQDDQTAAEGFDGILMAILSYMVKFSVSGQPGEWRHHLRAGLEWLTSRCTRDHPRGQSDPGVHPSITYLFLCGAVMGNVDVPSDTLAALKIASTYDGDDQEEDQDQAVPVFAMKHSTFRNMIRISELRRRARQGWQPLDLHEVEVLEKRVLAQVPKDSHSPLFEPTQTQTRAHTVPPTHEYESDLSLSPSRTQMFGQNSCQSQVVSKLKSTHTHHQNQREHMARHLSNVYECATLIYFQRGLLKMPLCAAQRSVEKGLDSIQAMEDISNHSCGCLPAWFAIVIGSECESNAHREFMISWFDRKRRHGLQIMNVACTVVRLVWEKRAIQGNQDLYWEDVDLKEHGLDVIFW
ncbi:hypothetical protein AYO20_10477 [Fonsecaea nubica]|uniref:Transcription factor domain-containing protein n=1 Tax=Fonsecaea nubica TaxID=856822 RepID=A0A178C8Z4_9EURO|nr:hypothetical protein AYO20_10477 [Fonsecaea nubica]OAL25443.1 hypothetical protein AYO20_10477 [Fonsecaea nubica]